MLSYGWASSSAAFFGSYGTSAFFFMHLHGVGTNGSTRPGVRIPSATRRWRTATQAIPSATGIRSGSAGPPGDTASHDSGVNSIPSESTPESGPSDFPPLLDNPPTWIVRSILVLPPSPPKEKSESLNPVRSPIPMDEPREPMTRSKTSAPRPSSEASVIVPWGLHALRLADWRSRRKREMRIVVILRQKRDEGERERRKR